MRPWVAPLALLAILAIGGCGGSPTSPSVPAARPPGANSAVRIGAGCGLFPAHGPGSFRSMSTQSVIAATASNPSLSVFSSAIKTSALDGRLSSRNAFTLFMPVNSAFSALTRAQTTYLRKPANQAAVVLRQVVPASITPSRIARGGVVTTLSGARLTLAKHGANYLVNAAAVVCGNIKTANGTIYVIDRVLLPPG
jgi:uncharacterized surface protein with fasciclin (FAS1) repeats